MSASGPGSFADGPFSATACVSAAVSTAEPNNQVPQA